MVSSLMSAWPWAGSFVEMLRTEVRQARITNSSSLRRRTENHIRDALYYACNSIELERAAENAAEMCVQFADHISQSGLFYSSDAPANRQARELALIAIDQFESALRDAKPSIEAQMLGGSSIR